MQWKFERLILLPFFLFLFLFLSGDSFSIPLQGKLQGGGEDEGDGRWFCMACSDMQRKTLRGPKDLSSESLDLEEGIKCKIEP